MNPCYDHCFLYYGLEYRPERCDETCEFAKAIQEIKKLKQEKEAYWIWNPNGMDREPFCCPVCGGRGTVSYSFYEPYKKYYDELDTTSTNPYIEMVTCRACGGTGIVWPPEEKWEIIY